VKRGVKPAASPNDECKMANDERRRTKRFMVGRVHKRDRLTKHTSKSCVGSGKGGGTQTDYLVCHRLHDLPAQIAIFNYGRRITHYMNSTGTPNLMRLIDSRFSLTEASVLALNTEMTVPFACPLSSVSRAAETATSNSTRWIGRLPMEVRG
jgi:hypothetical protein